MRHSPFQVIQFSILVGIVSGKGHYLAVIINPFYLDFTFLPHVENFRYGSESQYIGERIFWIFVFGKHRYFLSSGGILLGNLRRGKFVINLDKFLFVTLRCFWQ